MHVPGLLLDTPQRLLGCLTAVVCTIAASAGTAQEASPQAIVFFEKEVRPVLVEHCYDCHSAGGSVRGGLRLDTREGLRKGGDSGPAIVVGDADASLMIEAIRYQNRDLQMPPRNPLPERAVKVLEKWVAQGAADPRGPVSADRGSTDLAADHSPSGMSIDQGRQFWAFRPVSDPAIPELPDSNWVANPIDAFVLTRLQKNGLSPAPAADKVTLIRRITQDLIGLPPTPDQIDEFVADQSPSAYDKLIERLLNSPHYGVRWGRHWLDVARYADSNGLDENLGYGQAWRYRDYVVDAFNNDKPYDRFLIEQIAGDLLPEANRETKTATGFLALGAKVLAEPDRQKLEMDLIDEQLDTLGKAFLGMTFGCVRCHDHKFDPIKQSDYYALAAIFKSTKTLGDTNTGAIKHWYEHSFASEEETARLKEIDAQIAAKKQAAASYKNAAMAKIRQGAREQAADYLAAAARFDVATPLTTVAEIAEPLSLHPRILHHCRMHLDFHRDDPLWVIWHQLAEAGDADAIRRHYGDLFARAEQAFTAAKKQNPKATTLDDPTLQAARSALLDSAGFLAVPAKESFAFDPETLAEYYRLMDEARAFESVASDETAAMGVSEGNVVAQLPIHIRGSYKNLGEPVAREFPEVMRHSAVRPVFPSGQSGRLQLARWMADTRHPLTARVIVNRIWGWHFGEALVRTTENFGRLGDRPSHPELLDWLARRFMAGGWSIKDLHRLILRSNTYRLASSHPEQERYATIDPENRLLWKANLRRLEAEQIRDSILAVSGRLNREIGGKTLPLRNRQFVFNHTSEDHTKYDSVRRALYLPVIRNNLYAFFTQFDYPDPTMPTGSRNATVIAPQNLLLMNDELVMESADALARSVLSQPDDDIDRVADAYRRAVGREPSPNETERAIGFLTKLTDGAGDDDGRSQRQAWSLFCQSLMASNEFIYLR
ncbi:Planctomycete cytochrome C [Stieleria maiorica]|uniref:Planctomycete cytochrome C n=1 Tax=Stieleria maiorica TaxID=2795974 RepID=A0A5B9MKF4_9BACT|nr:PSD1 and planctomycete cytochrome C domain-containing protein [Stieleria maiorica]QEG00491.1 Planctomycete cytochrome C [Stieleria maiorica]